MGFLDKAKKMAEQAQAALDEAQKQFNTGESAGEAPSGPAVEYDEHGRPIPSAPSATASPPQGDPLADSASPVAPSGPAADPGAPPAAETAPAGADRPAPGAPAAAADPAGADRPAAGAPAAGADPAGADRPQGDPLAGAAPAPAPAEDRNRPSYAPPKLSSGDPLAG